MHRLMSYCARMPQLLWTHPVEAAMRTSARIAPTPLIRVVERGSFWSSMVQASLFYRQEWRPQKMLVRLIHFIL